MENTGSHYFPRIAVSMKAASEVPYGEELCGSSPMPKPLKDFGEGLVPERSINPLAQRPEHAALVGQIASVSEIIDSLVLYLAAILALKGGFQMTKDYPWKRTKKTKHEHIKKALPPDLPLPEELRKEIRNRLDAIEEFALERNAFVHAFWAICDQLPSSIIRVDRVTELTELAHRRHGYYFGFADLDELTKMYEPQHLVFELEDLKAFLTKLENFAAELVRLIEAVDPSRK